MPDNRQQLFSKAGTTALLAALIWSLVVFLSLWIQRGQLDRAAAELARIDALANLRKDMAIRKWAASVGGVFVKEEKVPDLGTLQEQERLSAFQDNGKSFKLITLTPIHILLAVQEVGNKEYGIKERLTSQQLRNRSNAPDEWETKALKSLEGGANIASERLQSKSGHGLMRVMIPMRMEDECMECHRDTLVPVGGLRGGAAITVDLDTYRSAQEPTWQSIRYWHFGTWLLGLATIYAFSFFAHRRALEHARQEEERRENEMAFSAMAEGALVTDARGTILWVNDAFCRIFGYAREEAIGKNPRILKSGRHGPAEYAEFWRQLTTVGHWRGELWNRRKSGEIFPEEISIQALRGPGGRINRYVSIFSDITERKRSEAELARHREHLEDLVRQRTEELTVARDEAEAANRAKSAFLANMSHELRTPLNAVIGFSELMDKDATLSPAQRRNLDIIKSSGSHLLTLINDVLELSKIEAGRMQLEIDEVNLEELLRQVIDMTRLRAEQAALELRLEAPGLPTGVLLDAVKLRQVLLNLLSNAVKFTPSGSITLDVRAREATPGSVRLDFSVKDTGIGIAPADQGRIFQPFEQAGTLGNHQGTGLGLTISSQYVRLMGGQLGVVSEPGKGASFSFNLVVPLGGPATSSHRTPRAVGLTDADRGRRLLVVDDRAETRLLWRSLLEPLGFEVTEAADGVAAQEMVLASWPHLILMDWRLPRCNGIEATRRIRANIDIPQPRIVMLTANALEDTRQQALAAGADDFMSKPCEEHELHAMLERQLGVRFVRQDAPDADTPLTAADVAGLSVATREALSRAALSLNHEKIGEALAGVEQENPELARRLRKLSDDMHYRQLWQALGIAGLD